MYQDLSSRNESKIRDLTNQVHQLQARLLDYKAQLDLKDSQIHQLNYENLQLKVQIIRINGLFGFDFSRGTVTGLMTEKTGVSSLTRI